MAVTPVRPVTFTGMGLSIVVPFPNCPLALKPQAPDGAVGASAPDFERVAASGGTAPYIVKARGLLRSITWDQGTEMARHLTIAQSLGAPIYFCDSRSPWQRGSNESMNGLLRDYFPKRTDLSIHSPEHLLAVENELNDRPRQVLNGRALRSPVSVQILVRVATLSRTRQSATGPLFEERRQR
jgi:hypothetical protein